MAAKRNVVVDYVDRHFITNEYGIWCPNCQEAIDAFWPDNCDHCEWPKADYDRFDEEVEF